MPRGEPDRLTGKVPLLVVEDEPDLRDALRDMLEFEGFTVRTAKNGAEALKQLDELGPVCVVLLDLMMPVMNGWELIEVLKTRQNPPPVVITSAATDAGDVQGVTDVLKKPFNMTRLIETVHRVCGTTPE